MARMKFICDAERCIECNGCVTACKAEHDVPWGVNRRRVVTLNDGLPGERSVSVACMHCSDAPCMAVCPVDCFYKTDEGVVLHDKDVCIGCEYCIHACPWEVITKNEITGKASKCTMCSDRISEDKQPFCVQACPVDCIHPAQGEPEFETVDMLYINPEECIDCGACEPACPVTAIFEESAVPPQWQEYTKINADHYKE